MLDKSWEPGMLLKTWQTFSFIHSFNLSFTHSQHAEHAIENFSKMRFFYVHPLVGNDIEIDILNIPKTGHFLTGHPLLTKSKSLGVFVVVLSVAIDVCSVFHLWEHSEHWINAALLCPLYSGPSNSCLSLTNPNLKVQGTNTYLIWNLIKYVFVTL